MTKKLSLALIVAVVVMVGAETEAKSFYCTNCSEKWMQALDRVTNVNELATLTQQLDNEISQTAYQLQMVQQNVQRYELMMKNTKGLSPDMVRRLSGELRHMGSLVRQLEVRRAEAAAARRYYNEMYPEQAAFGGMTTHEYQKQWDRWASESDRANRETYSLSAQQLNDLGNSQEFEAHVDELLATPEGQMEALQAGNKLSSMALQESRELRALLATQAQEQAQAAAMAQKEREREEANRRKFIKPGGWN